jgi:hypothetical protein
MFYSNREFNRWTTANYGLLEKYSTGVFGELSFTHKRLGGGFSIGYSAPITNWSFYFGYRLTGKYSPIGSWLNLQAGEISATFKNIAPVNYQLAPDEIGQSMELRYKAGYIGITSKNYLNFLHWNIKLPHGKIPVNVGVNASLGFTPFARNWRYGYMSYNDNDTTFVSHKVNSIPKMSKVYGSAGVFISL